MQTYYIFKITKEFKILTLNKPYNLYLALETIYDTANTDMEVASKLYDSVCEYFDIRSLNLSIFNLLESEDSYTKINNNHLINNYFTKETSRLLISKSYLKLKTSSKNSIFFRTLKVIPNLFIIDFKNKEYFWLTQ